MNDEIESAKLQQDLTFYVRGEHEAQRKSLARIWAMPLNQRVEEGYCVAGGRLQSVRPPKGVTIKFTANDSRFREGDFVRVSRGNPAAPLCEAVVVRAEDESIELEVWGEAQELMNVGQAVTDLQIDESALDLEQLYLGAIEELGRSEIGRSIILPLLSGKRKPLLDMQTYDEALKQTESVSFNEQQATAVASALAADVCWLIHGPPGTGKTRVLAWIVKELMQRGERVLVTSASHRAINNLLEAITALVGDNRGIFKIAPFLDPTCRVMQFKKFAEIPREQTSGAFVIGTTPFSTKTSRLSGVDFDTIIVDEASQVSVPLAVMAMLAGKRYILAGDHQQLPPVRVAQSMEDDLAHGSIFECLVRRGMDTMLTITHRLNEPLCQWPSTTFYLSRLEPSPAAAGRRLAVSKKDGVYAEVLRGEPACVWLAVSHEGSRTSSPEEVEYTSQLLLALRAGGIRWEDVGVVVPFRRQARLIRQRLALELSQPIASLGLVADTVERMQGQEREVVIVTFAASDPGFISTVAKFLFQPQRLNVAVTRARTKVVLVASPSLVEQAESLPEDLSMPFLTLIKSACRIDVDEHSYQG